MMLCSSYYRRFQGELFYGLSLRVSVVLLGDYIGGIRHVNLEGCSLREREQYGLNLQCWKEYNVARKWIEVHFCGVKKQ